MARRITTALLAVAVAAVALAGPAAAGSRWTAEPTGTVALGSAWK